MICVEEFIDIVVTFLGSTRNMEDPGDLGENFAPPEGLKEYFLEQDNKQ